MLLSQVFSLLNAMKEAAPEARHVFVTFHFYGELTTTI